VDEDAVDEDGVDEDNVDEDVVEEGDLDQPLAQRRNRREHRRLPKRYRDMEPEPLPSTSSQILHECVQAEPDASQCCPQQQPLLCQVKQVFQSACDGFGLFRQYYATCLPEHDTSQNSSSNSSIDTSPPVPDNIYYPYPNQSSFLLGEWYWNGGEKKSQSSFQNLLQIVGHPSFRPEDVSGNNWRLIDARLSGKRVGGPNDDDSAAKKKDDADWIRTPVKISVPFHGRMLHPGPKDFDAGILHHRKLISVIKEKVTRSTHLHFEPYEFFWKPNDATEPVRVYGELYTSEAFFEAHRMLQDSPGESGCELLRVVLGLMFASDSTQLTTFGSAKLCPVYLGLGNESKDRRSKPSCQAFEHIAYLEAVREVPF
jgi:hypothetical protein